MIEHRPVSELGGGDHGWLKALHHFHIGAHGNPAHKALGNLYVWNDDELAPGTGFPPHPHRDVEIITYVREGYVSHRDSLGNEGRIEAGDVQVMSAGTGIQHAEVGASDQRTRIFQIWLHPRAHGGEPRWGTRPFPKSDRAGRFVVLASGFIEDADALVIRADARALGATLAAGQSLTYDMAPGRKAYLVATSGRITVNDVPLEARDGAAVRDEATLRIEALADTEIVLVDTV
ncbi:pirin family protein (plasmid) [Brevundimonas staleyi]|uniref:Pirin family protein n=1 Tax=Brevundimonas staleyi TaxID=74326 RepID=A0ABW0FR30_9CAUL